jgi:tyrosine phenol-lyase
MVMETKQKSWAEPYKIKVVEPIKVTSSEEREKYIKEAGFNTFLLRSEDVYIDLLTDSGTGAMSDKQWSALMLGDEAYAGSRNFYELENTVREYYGYKYFIPTHQGRGAEHIMSKVLIKEGDYVPGNMYFTTTKIHQELAGGQFVDVIVDEAHDVTSNFPFKGNVDLNKMQALINKVGAEKIPYISLETNVNMAGGQPISMQNIRELHDLCKKYEIPIMLDATRIAENAYFIQKRESEYKNKSIKEIVFEICSYTDGCTMSAKKDCLVNIGGFFACNKHDICLKAQNLLVIYEGLQTYGGMAGRDMAAVAQGIRESVDERHQQARIGQVEYLGEKLLKENIPIVTPIGSHAVFLDAKRFLPDIKQDDFPAQALAAEIYVTGGIRTMERGNVSAGRNSKTGENINPPLELVRLTFPRRVYTQAHVDIVLETVLEVYKNREQIKGLEFIYEPKELRFFQSRFKKK